MKGLLPVEKLSVPHLQRNPVWEISEDEELGVVVSPVTPLPVSSLAGRLVGCQVVLRNQLRVWAQLSNIHLDSKLKTEQFLLLAVERDGKWQFLSRYFDSNYPQNGPAALAEFLGLQESDIFPIRYDITQYVTHQGSVPIGEIPRDPPARLTTRERIRLSVSGEC